MAELEDKVEHALDESRMLILGTQVLLGFQFRVAFESDFPKLPRESQQLEIVGVGLILAALVLLMSPVAHHHIVGHGESPEQLNAFSTKVVDAALLPFALGIGVDLFLVVERLGYLLGVIIGASAALLALFFWYGLEFYLRTRLSRHERREIIREKQLENRESATEIAAKVSQVLTEARMVLPGAQALLGFQTIIMVAQDFDNLAPMLKYIHLASLLMTTLATILLMTPAAYHRIVNEGEDTQAFHRLASWFVVAAMIPLALGITGDVLVVIAKVTGSILAGSLGAGLALLFIYGLWFGFSFILRKRSERTRLADVETQST